MSEEVAESTPDENPDDATPPAPAAEGSGRGRFMILIGALLLLGGTFIGMRVARLVPPDEDPAAIAGGAAGPQLGDIPAFLHYFNVCERAEQDGRRISLVNVVAALAPPTLPAPARMTVAVAVSASSPDRPVRLQGIAPGNVIFFDEPLKLDPVDPTRPSRHFFEVQVELTSPEPLAFILTSGDLVIARRHLFVRPRDREPATTAPGGGGSGEAATQPAAGPAAAK